MRLIVDIAKSLGANIAKEIVLINDYLRSENKALRKIIQANNISMKTLDDEMRRELSERGRKLSPITRPFCIKIASPKTVVYKWGSKVKGKMNDSSDKRAERKKTTGQPRLDEQVRELVIKLAREHSNASLRFIADALKMMDFKVSHTTVKNILKAEGIPPSPDRMNGMTWHEFLQKAGMWQMDCTTTHIVMENPVTKKTKLICYHRAC